MNRSECSSCIIFLPAALVKVECLRQRTTKQLPRGRRNGKVSSRHDLRYNFDTSITSVHHVVLRTGPNSNSSTVRGPYKLKLEHNVVLLEMKSLFCSPGPKSKSLAPQFLVRQTNRARRQPLLTASTPASAGMQ